MKLRTILFASLLMLMSFTTIKETESVSLTHELLYEQINQKNIKFPDIVFAQAVLESGHFKAPLFINQNNLFGMRIPKKRETTAINKGKQGYALYHNWDSSIDDYLLWQEFTLKNRGNLTRSQYFALLGRVYASDKKYVSSLKRVISQNQEILN
jgi:flagellum-specific peptidoglycan hydrolase FlgJ